MAIIIRSGRGAIGTHRGPPLRYVKALRARNAQLAVVWPNAWGQAQPGVVWPARTGRYSAEGPTVCRWCGDVGGDPVEGFAIEAAPTMAGTSGSLTLPQKLVPKHGP